MLCKDSYDLSHMGRILVKGNSFIFLITAMFFTPNVISMYSWAYFWMYKHKSYHDNILFGLVGGPVAKTSIWMKHLTLNSPPGGLEIMYSCKLLYFGGLKNMLRNTKLWPLPFYSRLPLGIFGSGGQGTIGVCQYKITESQKALNSYQC